MGDLPLRTPTHRRFGGPLPRQLPNATHAHPWPELLPLTPGGCPPRVLRGISPDFSGLSPCQGQVAYVLLTRAPVAGRNKQAYSPAAPRLACVKPVASVHPEPGSNSSLLFILFFFFFLQKSKIPRLLSLFFAFTAPCGSRGGLRNRHCLSLGLTQVTRNDFRHRDSELTELFVVTNCSCTTLCLYCKSFNVLSWDPRELCRRAAYFPKANAKLQRFFLPTKYFYNYFLILTLI